MAEKIEESFAATTKLLFGKPLASIAKYADWLKQRVPPAKAVPSAFGNGAAYVPEYGFFRKVPLKNMVRYEQQPEAAKKNIGIVSGNETIASISGRLPLFAYFVPGFMEGTNLNVQDCSGCIDCLDLKNCYDPFTSKRSAYAHSIIDSDSIFGMFRIIGSSFSMHCYNAYYMQRCFEMDHAIKCADSYFCHNVENLSDCMFCFNTKSKRYAIGNVELGKEKYFEMKKKLVAEMVAELEKNGRLKVDIYDVLAKKK